MRRDDAFGCRSGAVPCATARVLALPVALTLVYACAAGRPAESPDVAVVIPSASPLPVDPDAPPVAIPRASIEAPTPEPHSFRIDEIAPGVGPVASAGDTVEIAYAITFADGTPIDTTLGHSTVRFQIGVREVIPGLAVALSGVRRGTRRRVTLPAGLGGGLARGLPQIPEGSAIFIDFEIVLVYPVGTQPPTP